MVSNSRRRYAGSGEPGGKPRANASASDAAEPPESSAARFSPSKVAKTASKALAAYSSTATREPVLAAEVMDDQRRAHPGRLRDLPDGHGVVAMLGEQPQGGVADGGPGGEVPVVLY